MGVMKVAVIRVNKTRDYTVMSNTHFKEKGMSLKAKGLLSMMLSLPDDWDYSIKGLTTLSSDGEASIRVALKELERFKYLRREAIREKGKIIDWQYHIYEKPYVENQQLAKPQQEEPQVEKPVVEKPHVVNHAQLNTNQSNTNQSNIKESNTNELAKEIIDYLNQKVGTKFKHTTAETKKHINGRIDDGYTLDDFKTVIDKKYDEWYGTEMQQYLRPSTLFSPTNFENYLNAVIIPKKPKQQNNVRNTGPVPDWFKNKDKQEEKYEKVSAEEAAKVQAEINRMLGRE